MAGSVPSAARERLERWKEPPSRRLRGGLLAGHALVGAVLVQGARATPSVEWMKLYRLEDFRSWEDVGHFFAELHTGIPPFLALLDVASMLLFGSADATSVWLYRATLLAAFGLPFLCFARTRIECVLSFLLGVLFLAATRVVTAANPLVYDPLLPVLVLGFVATVGLARRTPSEGRARLVLVGAGVLLALAELTRPFALLLLLPLLLHAGLALGGRPRHRTLALLLPVVLLSGGWHLKLLVAHEGQLLWSSHGGFNLYRLWKQEVAQWPAFTRTPHWWRGSPEPSRFPARGEWSFLHLNTANHAERSAELTGTVVRHVWTHPISSTRLVIGQVGTLLRPRTSLMGRDPQGPLLDVYRSVTPVVAVWFGVQLLGLCTFTMRREGLAALARPEAALLLSGGLCIALLAVGEAGEEARMVVTVLPLLAALPRVPWRAAGEEDAEQV